MKNLLSVFVAVGLVYGISDVSLAAHKTTMMKKRPLAERLGGYKAISALVKDFVENQVARDERINKFFAKTDMKHLEEMLTDQLCTAGGGWKDSKHRTKCTYTGKDMKTAHAGMGVQEADFNALVEDLDKSMTKFKIPAKEKNEMVLALAPMKSDIVEPARDTSATKQ